MEKLILLGLNELNFEMVKAYTDRGQLPHFKKLFDQHDIIKTTSEKAYKELEPWIQWVSIQTGKPYSEHKIFRLGDVTDANIPQIWEHLEGEYGIKVGAVSPMNAANRCIDPAFFVSDPWTKTQTSGGWLLNKISIALADAVNENATGKSKISSYIFILLGVLRYSIWRNPKITLHILKALKTKYERATLLDHLLADIFIDLWKLNKPQFSSLFLNSCAHLQHHYLFNAAPYNGAHKNPDWYIGADEDPVLSGFQMYDLIIGKLLALPKTRLIIATGLHQDPVEAPVFYWRLNDHSAFLNQIGVSFQDVLPRMSRDFLVQFHDKESCVQAEKKLKACMIEGKKVFEEMDNRGESLFVTLTYPDEITEKTNLVFDGGEINNFKNHVGFVAIKNGHHNGDGYLIDTEGMIPADRDVKITDIFELIDHHFARENRRSENINRAA